MARLFEPPQRMSICPSFAIGCSSSESLRTRGSAAILFTLNCEGAAGAGRQDAGPPRSLAAQTAPILSLGMHPKNPVQFGTPRDLSEQRGALIFLAMRFSSQAPTSSFHAL